MKIGIISAIHEEVESLISLLEQKRITEVGSRIFYEGTHNGIEIVVVFSRWGKVSTAATTTTMILKFNVDKILFLGLAGALVPDLKMGDVVIGQHYFQHDMDARPHFKHYEIPLLGRTSIETPQAEVELACNAVHNFLKNAKELRKVLTQHQVVAPSMYVGDIASGDLNITGAQRKATINKNLPSVLCVDMESAAAAQVCFNYEIPFISIRTISDTADENLGILENNLHYFAQHLSTEYMVLIIQEYLSIIEDRIKGQI